MKRKELGGVAGLKPYNKKPLLLTTVRTPDYERINII